MLANVLQEWIRECVERMVRECVCECVARMRSRMCCKSALVNVLVPNKDKVNTRYFQASEKVCAILVVRSLVPLVVEGLHW
jgi:hypothetical protein